MSMLPDEMWTRIMEIGVGTKRLDYRNLCCLSITCRRLRRLAADDSLWSSLLLSDFPSSSKNLENARNYDGGVGVRDKKHTSSSTANDNKSLYKIRYEKDRQQKLLAHKRAVLRIESEIAEHSRKIREIELHSFEEKEKMNKAIAELRNLHKIRQASVAVKVWQPEIIRGRQRQMIEQNDVPVDSRINALEMELSLCKQQISGFDKALLVEKRKLHASREQLATAKYHPLQEFSRASWQSNECKSRRKKLKHNSSVNF